jgi:hypothetical protein
MNSNPKVAAAYHRLLERLGTDQERTALDRHKPLDRPTEADLMCRAIDNAADPAVDDTDLRAALQLADLDQRNAVTREINIVARLRERRVSWADIAALRGLRSAQAAQQRHDRLTVSHTREVVIFAFRVAGDEQWHGHPNALPDGNYETGTIDFNPSTPRPLSGLTLQLRYGPAAVEIMESHLRAYAMVNERRIATSALVQRELFGG